ncbi:hypothetical protein E8E12_002726 [Didymella heteroderae]|uniref:2-dehydropantoate 2-reductase n=1 Tax=Didymella heteroderae TaxID=1769908 RepID=A0A9P4WI99_9PLEO|nr:hypothetical protein E8E12_002726 [Didymella heteroderae]
MTDSTRPRVLLFGAGGIGTVYLWLLSKTSTTTAVCRSNYDVAKKDGFIINSSIFGQNIHFRPNVVKSCEEAASADPTPFDYIVVCSKAIPGTVPKWIASAVTPGHTAIVLLQNGIGIEDEYQAAFPGNPIISTVLYFPATQRPAGVITHGEIERLEIGAFPTSAPDTHAKAFAALITAAGATAVLHADIQQVRWTKLLINASWNPICALARSKDTDVLASCVDADSVIEAVMLEIRDIAAAYGYVITHEKVQFELGRAKARIPINAGIEPIGDGKRDGKNDYSVRSLLDTALTCQRLASVAREALCTAPVLQSGKVDLLIAFLFKYPDLMKKIKCVTIETQETRKDNAYPLHMAHLDPDVLSHCKRHVRHLPIRKCIQDGMIALLKAPRFECHSILLGLLLTMLPKLEHLYLGGSILLNFPLFRAMIPNEPEDTEWHKPDWAAGPDLTWMLSLIGPRLTHLELPIDLRRNPEANIWTPLSIAALPSYFPRLQWLSMPHMAATEITKTSAADVVPPLLHTLILTDARCDCFAAFSRGLVREESSTPVFPELRKIALYHRYPSPGADADVVDKLAQAGIDLREYDPNCCLRSGDEFYHPWKYTPDEIGALEESRHRAYETEWQKAALQCDSDEE